MSAAPKHFVSRWSKIAMADNRQCHVALFSTEQVHYDFLGSDGIEQMTPASRVLKALEQTRILSDSGKTTGNAAVA